MSAIDPAATLPAPIPRTAEAQDRKLREAAQELEANFLAEMLKAAGVTF